MLRITVQFALHIRFNLLYAAGGHLYELQQIFDPRYGAALSLFYKGVLRAGIRPRRWQEGLLAVFGDMVHPPLAPASLTIDQLKPLAPLRMKRVGDGEKLLGRISIGCSARPKINQGSPGQRSRLPAR